MLSYYSVRKHTSFCLASQALLLSQSQCHRAPDTWNFADDLIQYTLQVMRTAKEAMISEFGQTPAQLFDENQPHPARKVIQPVPKDPLPGYRSSSLQSPEISHTLVHILLEVSASESMHSVLSSPQPRPAAPLAHASSAPSPLALVDQEQLRSPTEPKGPISGGAFSNPEAPGVFVCFRVVCLYVEVVDELSFP
jgi:hypothetical protein